MKEVLLLLFGDEFREYFSLTARQKFYVWYFCLSLCFLCITDDSPIWAIIVVVLNFANWKSHATLTLLATQDLPTFGYNMIDPLKSWCWGSILFYPFKISRFS